jgi:hypothetical protein
MRRDHPWLGGPKYVACPAAGIEPGGSMLNTPIVVSAGSVVVIATILVLVAGRREPDAERSRTITRYVDSVALLSTFVALFAAYAIVAELSRFIINSGHRFGNSAIDNIVGSASGGQSSSGIEFGPSGFYHHVSNDVIWRGVVQAGLVLLAAGVILAFHRRHRAAITAGPGFDASAGARVDLAFRYCVCFVAAFVILMSLAFGLYGLFQAIAPGIASAGGGSTQRERGIATAVSLLALGLGSVVVFRAHWSERMRLTAPAEPADSAAFG